MVGGGGGKRCDWWLPNLSVPVSGHCFSGWFISLARVSQQCRVELFEFSGGDPARDAILLLQAFVPAPALKSSVATPFHDSMGRLVILLDVWGFRSLPLLTLQLHSSAWLPSIESSDQSWPEIRQPLLPTAICPLKNNTISYALSECFEPAATTTPSCEADLESWRMMTFTLLGIPGVMEAATVWDPKNCH